MTDLKNFCGFDEVWKEYFQSPSAPHYSRNKRLVREGYTGGDRSDRRPLGAIRCPIRTYGARLLAEQALSFPTIKNGALWSGANRDALDFEHNLRGAKPSL